MRNNEDRQLEVAQRLQALAQASLSAELAMLGVAAQSSAVGNARDIYQGVNSFLRTGHMPAGISAAVGDKVRAFIEELSGETRKLMQPTPSAGDSTTPPGDPPTQRR